MRLRHLELKNFMSHERAQLALPEEGFFFLSGPSGAGKSSFIVDAVAFALFGTKATRAKRTEQLRNIDRPGEPMEVRALFEFEDGSQFTIVRGLNAKGQTWAELYEPDSDDYSQSIMLADSSQQVARIVRRRLGGMTWQQFYAAFVARQVEISMLTSLRGAERKDLVHRLLGMRELEKAAEEVSARLRTQRAQVRGLEAQVGEKTRKGEDMRIEALRKELVDREAELRAARRDLEASREELKKVEEIAQSLEISGEAAREAGELERQVQARKEAIQELERAVQRSRAAGQTASGLEALEDETQKVEARYEVLRADYARSIEHKRLLDELSLKEGHLRPLPETIKGKTPEEIKARQKALDEELERLRVEETERREALERLKETGVCYTCLQPLGEGHERTHVLGQLEERISQLERAQRRVVSELVELEEALPKAEAAKHAREEAVRRHAGAEGAIKEIRARLKALEGGGQVTDDLDALKSEGQAARATLEALQEKVAQARSAQEAVDQDVERRLQEGMQRLAADETALRAARSRIKDGFNKEVLESARRTLQGLRESMAGQDARIPVLERQVESVRAMLQGAEAEREAITDKIERLEDMRSHLVRLEDLQTYLQGFQRKLAHDIRPPLEEMGSEMLEQISAGKHVAMRIDDSYEIEVQTQAGSWLSTSSLSGGESVRVNICLRLALTRLVSQRTGIPVRMLVFDEPLPAQDTGHVQRIMALLESLRPWYPQQFIISHVGEVRSSDEIDYVIEFEGEEENRVSLIYA